MMTTCIGKLTPKQEAMIPVWREEWRAIGLSTERIVSNTSRQAIRDLYGAAGLDEPELILVAQSPMQALMMRGVLMNTGIGGQLGKQFGNQLREQLGNQLPDQLGGQFWDQLGDQLRSQLGDQVRDQLGDQVRDQLGRQLRGQLGRHLADRLWDQVRGQLGDQLGRQLSGQLSGQLWGQLEAQLGDQLAGRLVVQLHSTELWQPPLMVGGWDSFWLALCVAGRSVGARFPKGLDGQLSAYVQYAQCCGPAFCYPKIAFVCDRPTVIEMDEARRLHCETGPALSWSDGYAVHAWHGRQVPARWIEETASIDPVEVIQHQNVEMRATGAAILGWPRMHRHLDAKVIDDSGNPDIGQLIELTFPGLPVPGRFLKAECPRNGTIVEGVPFTSDIDGLPIDTAIAAQAWRIGDPQSEYIHPTQRT